MPAFPKLPVLKTAKPTPKKCVIVIAPEDTAIESINKEAIEQATGRNAVVLPHGTEVVFPE